MVNGLRAGSTFGRRGVPPILQVKPDDEWEDDVELYDGMGRLVASHRPSDGTWTLPLAVGLYKLTYGVGGERRQEIVDHSVMGPTLLDFRPRLTAPIVRVWGAATANRWFPARDGQIRISTIGAASPRPPRRARRSSRAATHCKQRPYWSISNLDLISNCPFRQ